MSAADVRAIRDGLACGKSRCSCRTNGNTHCPAHPDDSPSLSVKAGARVPVIVTCHGGCPQDAVIAALKDRRLWPETERRIVATGGRKPAIKYPARLTADGAIVAYHVRLDLLGGGKRMWWERPDGTKGLGGLSLEDFALYGAGELPPGVAVVLTEGEKARDALTARGGAAVGTMTGSSMTPCDAALRPLLDHPLILWPDNDDAGRKHMLAVAVRLRELGHSDVRLLAWAEAPEHGDAADFAGDDDELRKLVDEAAPFDAAAPDGSCATEVSIAETLDAVRVLIARYVVMTSAQFDAVALWVAHSHAIAAAAATPYLAITSAEKRSGKTRLLEILAELVARPWLTGKTTAAALIRKIDKNAPTLLLDESDAAFKGDKEYAQTLRGVLNTGHRRGGAASLCVGKGADVRDFQTFCPKAIAGIGNLPDTVSDRAIQISMKRRVRGEVVDRFRHRHVRAAARPAHDALALWARSAVGNLTDAEPTIPDALDDRAADGWEPLLAIADLAGGEWPARARAAALALSAGDVRDDDSIGVRLLSDIRAIFQDADANRLASATLAETLAAIEDAPWGAWGRRDKPMDARALARLLTRYGIKPRTVRDDAETFKGYAVEWFADAFGRYLPLSERHAVTTDSELAPVESTRHPSQLALQPSLVTDTDGPIAAVSDSERAECDGVTDDEAPTAREGDSCALCGDELSRYTDAGVPCCDQHWAEAQHRERTAE